MTYTARELRELGRPISAEAIELRRWRREHYLTIAELAAILGVSNSTLEKAEIGRARLPRSYVPLIRAMYARWSRAALPATAVARAERRTRRIGAITEGGTGP